jgi:8-oxo-dGTP pyrophosphatase MutT (NUDIX family)
MRKVLPKNAVTIPKEATRVFKGIVYDTYQWQQKLFDNSFTTFEMLKRPDTVKVLAVKDDHLVVIEQEQPNQRKFYDIPGGMHDQENETELEATQRELLEETGLIFKTWRLLTAIQPHRKIEQFVYIFLATDFVESVEPNTDAGEKIKVHLLPFDKAKELLSSADARFFPEVLREVNSIEDLYKLASHDQ